MQALEIILEPGEDSELTDLEDSDTEDDVKIPDNALEMEDNDDITDFENNDQQTVDVEPNREDDFESAKGSHVSMEKVLQPQGYLSFKGALFSIPENEKTLLQYFQIFWNHSLKNYIADQTNLYSIQKLGKSICTNESEIQKFIGIQILMSIMKLPRFEMYWSTESRFLPVADIMTVNRYKKL